MNLLQNTDFYTVKLRGYVTSLHLKVLDLLYQPFIGIEATTLYRFLHATADLKSNDVTTINLLKFNTGMTNEQISGAFNKLESVGLVTTFVTVNSNYNDYVFELNAPKDPAQFNQDPIFMYLLEQAMSPLYTQDLLSLFKLDKETTSGENITMSFTDVFSTNMENQVSVNSVEPINNNIGKVRYSFDDALFYNVLTGERKILPTALSKEEFTHLKKIATLFDVNESGLARLVADHYESSNPLGSRIDLSRLQAKLQQLVKYEHIRKPIRRQSKPLSGESEKIALINEMETLNPYDFLVKQNHGTKVADADGKILTSLAFDFNLTNPVINALVYYVLKENDYKLGKAYTEKIASTLVRNRVTNALDTLDILEKGIKPKNVKTVVNDNKGEKIMREDEATDEEIDEETWAKLGLK